MVNKVQCGHSVINVFNTGEIEWKLTTGIKSLIKQLLYSYEKKVQSFYYFSRNFFSIFQDLFQVLPVRGSIDNPANGNWN